MEETPYASLLRAAATRPEMNRAVDTNPVDRFFPHAHALLTHAQVPGRERDDLLIVMQRVRLGVESHAARRGVPPEVLAETSEPKANTSRRGHFEHDLVHAYLPDYLAHYHQIGVCFRHHARGAYRDTLRQRGRREWHRAELWAEAPEDARTRQELAAPTAADPNAVTTGATHFAQWVPTPAEIRASLGFLQQLERMLDPLDYQVAEILMKHGAVQGDLGEIARLLSVREGRRIYPSRITRALESIARATELIRVQRGVRRW
jgi:DNA-directed RNA polymerase specialized sigma24 family protein